MLSTNPATGIPAASAPRSASWIASALSHRGCNPLRSFPVERGLVRPRRLRRRGRRGAISRSECSMICLGFRPRDPRQTHQGLGARSATPSGPGAGKFDATSGLPARLVKTRHPPPGPGPQCLSVVARLALLSERAHALAEVLAATHAVAQLLLEG